MATLYLIEQNTILRKTSDRLVLCRKRSPADKAAGLTVRDTLLELPCEDVSQVMLFGNVQVTTQALQQLLKHGIELAIFTRSGRLLGQLTPPRGKNIPLRIAQFERYQDSGFGLRLSQNFVRAKLMNALSLVNRYRSNYPEMVQPGETAKLRGMAARVESAKDGATLLGLEGAATALYFKMFSRMFKPPWQFSKRTRRPPKDPVNAVLSFGYVIVGSELQSLLDGVGLDPYLGFYHAVRYGRPGLALDLLEAFRQPVVDRLAVKLFNLNMLDETDFFKPAQGGVYLSWTGKKKFFEQYEKMMGEYAELPEQRPEESGFRAEFQQSVQGLAAAIRDNTDYEPFRSR